MEASHIPTLLLIGLAILAGTAGGRVFQFLRIPQVVGYIVIGVLIGKSGFHLIGDSEIAGLSLFNFFALGVIGFLVGGELKMEEFRKYFRQYVAILVGEGVLAFLLVGLSSGLILYAVSHSFAGALAGGIVLGAIASATDPASTIDVLWEYRCGGALTATVIAIVALDDALAMTLYGVGTGCAQMITSHSGSITAALLKIGIELGGAIALGAACAVAFRLVLRWMHKPEKMLPLALGLILLIVGLCVLLDMDVIMASMAMGFVLVNLAPMRTKSLFEIVRTFSVPIYVVFFVLIGARLYVSAMPLWLWGLVAAYVVMRSLGKMFGARAGAKITKSPVNVQHYLGLTLFAQGGVAVGLSIMASSHLQNIHLGDSGISLGDTIIACVTATTLIVQLLGPASVKLAVTKAGERNQNITEEQLLESLKVGDIQDVDAPVFREHTRVAEIMETIAGSDAMYYAVLNKEQKVVGILTVNGLRRCMWDIDMSAWLVAADLMEPVHEVVTADGPLADAVQRLRETRMDAVPIVDKDEGHYVGMLELRDCEKRISNEVWKRRNAPREAIA